MSREEPSRTDRNEHDPRFVEYYKNESASDAAAERARGIMRAVLRTRKQAGKPTEHLRVADIGCNAGTQSRCWLEGGHDVCGLDISQNLVEIARLRNAEFGERARYEVGSASNLPWKDDCFDVCLLPELLEHVEDWRACLLESARVLKSGGTLYLSTTNVLCPVQQEFSLPAYSWYPKPLKAHFVHKALTTDPGLVNFASHPAYHWFSPYGLKKFLAANRVDALDRFEILDVAQKSPMTKLVGAALRQSSFLRFAGHVLTPSTILIGFKR